MDVATLKDVCDNLDPLCSPDDSCHILILHIQVSETPGDAGNLSENNTAAHPDLLNHTSTLLQAHDPCLHFQLHVILVCVSSSCVYPYYLVFTIAQFRKTACFITYLVCALTQPQKQTGLMSLMSNLDCSLHFLEIQTQCYLNWHVVGNICRTTCETHYYAYGRTANFVLR